MRFVCCVGVFCWCRCIVVVNKIVVGPVLSRVLPGVVASLGSTVVVDSVVGASVKLSVGSSVKLTVGSSVGLSVVASTVGLPIVEFFIIVVVVISVVVIKVVISMDMFIVVSIDVIVNISKEKSFFNVHDKRIFEVFLKNAL